MKRALTPVKLAAPLSLLIALPALSLPAAAQSADGTSATLDPWRRITVILVSPPGESPYDAAQRAADAAFQAEATLVQQDALTPTVTEKFETAFEEGEEEEPVLGTLAPETQTPAPSLWNVLRAGLGMEPAQKPAESPVPQRQPVTAAHHRPLPTRLEMKQGPASVAVSTSAQASAPVSGALGTRAGGGSGEVKGRIGFEQDNFTVYSTGALGASASTGTPSLYDNLAIGSTYSVPLAPIGLSGNELGASVEMNRSQTVTTGVELRAPLGSYQRFISVKRSATPDSDGTGAVRAGVLGKF